MNIDMTTTQIVVALFILCLCGVLILFKTSNKTFPHEGPCFKCNETDLCGTCPTFSPYTHAVKSAYVRVSKNGRTVATTTLTFDKDFVYTQHPKYHSMPDFVGWYKTAVMAWCDAEKHADVKITFS